MKKERVKGLAALLTAGYCWRTAAAALTTTRVTSETEQLVSYVDDASGTVSMQASASGSAGQTTAQQANDGKTNATTGKESAKTTASGIKDTSSNNAGRVDNKTEEKLTGSFELQIFVGGLRQRVLGIRPSTNFRTAAGTGNQLPIWTRTSTPR